MKRLFLSLLVLCLTLTVSAENYPNRSDYLWYTVPNHADWNYQVGEKASVEVMFLLYGMPQDVTVDYAIVDEGTTAEKNLHVTLKNGKGTISGITSKKPGFRDIQMQTTLNGVKYQHHIKLAFSPEKIVPYTQEPKDFVQWWEKNIAENQKYPLKFTKELYEPYCSEKVDCYIVKIEVNKQHQSVYGYLTCPKNMEKGKHPVILCPPGAGVKTIKEPMSRNYFPENGFIRFITEIHGMDPRMPEEYFSDVRAAFDGKTKGYLYQNLDNRDNFYMRHVYEGLVKCIDFLTQMPEWDGKNVIVQGGSQGGALSLIAAGLDKRVNYVVANHPALSDMARAVEGGVSGYPHYTAEEGMLTKDRLETMAYYDVVNFARHITAKTYMTWGYNDNTCPPTTSYAVWNVLTCPKEKLVTPINEHWTSEATNRQQCTWLLEQISK